MGVIRPTTGLRRTQSGRLTKRPMRTAAAMSAARKDWVGYAYLATAFVAVLVPSVVVGTLVRGSSEQTKWIVGYVIYGCIAVFCVALPSALAYWVSDVPFPTLFRTISVLERLWRPIAVVIVAGLAVLVVHLALYPFPAGHHAHPPADADQADLSIAACRTRGRCARFRAIRPGTIPRPASRSASPAAATARCSSTSAPCGGSTTPATCRSSTASRASPAARSRPACSALAWPGSTSTRTASRALRTGGRRSAPRSSPARRSTCGRSSSGSSCPARSATASPALRRTPLRRRDAAGPARPAALRHQRDQPAVGRALALLEAVHARLPRRRGQDPTCRSPSRSPPRRRSRRCCRRSSSSSTPRTSTPGAAPTCSARRSRPEVVLSDGGVYDNLGLETAWKRYQTILVSDGGGQIGGKSDPSGDWPRHAHPRPRRDRQPGARAAQAPGDRRLRAGRREGAYWGIRTDIARLRLADALPCPHRHDADLARTRRGSSRWIPRCRSG